MNSQQMRLPPARTRTSRKSRRERLCGCAKRRFRTLAYEVHRTAVFAPSVSRWIKARTGWSIHKVVKTACRYRIVQIQVGLHVITSADPLQTSCETRSRPSPAHADLRTDLS